MANEHRIDILLKLIVDNVFVFSYCEDDEIELDFAVKQMERIWGTLETLDPTTYQAFIAKVHEEAKREAQAGNEQRAEQLIGLITDCDG